MIGLSAYFCYTTAGVYPVVLHLYLQLNNNEEFYCIQVICRVR